VDLRELSKGIESGQLSPVEHVAEVLDRLAADECNAVVYLDPDDALDQARRHAEEIRGGSYRGPLHGVAVAVKDLFDVRGMPTRCGSNVLRDVGPAQRDAPAVASLREAGAVIVAKTHTHEFAFGPTGSVAAEGPARNPHDLSRITGGSSSGSAAAVAAGHVPLGLGTDTGCSVRTPAALCGVVGLKPRFGRISTDRVFPLAETCDHVGVIGADVHAVSAGYQALTGQPGRTGPDSGGTGRLRRNLVIGRPVDEYWRPFDEAIAKALEVASRQLAETGARIIDVQTPGIDELAATYRPIVGCEAYATHAQWLQTRRQDYQQFTADRLLRFAGRPATGYIQAQRAKRRLSGELFEHLSVDGVDVLLTPTTPIRATPIGEPTVDGHDVVDALLSLTLPFNLNGWPALSVPVPPPDGGLPLGVQLVGVTAGEFELLSLAEALSPP
jgi:aspartyl-tRNA(Asn)/glutamyl-tRNA(Gln) amidotransferase subunit A